MSAAGNSEQGTGAAAESADSPLDPLGRPIFIVCPPCSGESLLAASMLASPGSWHPGEGAEALTAGADDLPEADPQTGNRYTADQAATAGPAVREGLLERYRGLDMTGRPGDAAPRLFDAAPRGALRVPFLDSIFPDALFVYLHRDPRRAVSAALQLWQSGKAVTYPDLEGWTGPPWSLLLVPGWSELAGLKLEEIVVEQWRRTGTMLLDDLEQLPPERWCVADYEALLTEPEDEVQRIFSFLGLGWHSGCSAPWQQAARARLSKGDPSPPDSLAELLPRLDPIVERATDWIAPLRSSQATEREPGSLTAVDEGLARMLKRLGSSLLVSTYQTNRVIALRHDDGALGVHLRSFDRPMGIAARDDGFALGVRSEVLDYRDFPAVAHKLEPAGRHDACFVPRNSHYTADIAVHDLAFAGDELWLVATSFSCLATLDAQHSFVPRWKPPFVSALAPEDRCHLNGLAVVGDAPRYVTALGVSDERGGWRANKATGGVVIDVRSGEVVIEGLSMPHSPRWHDGALWLLESGKGTLSVCDVESGEVETVSEMPGFTRGLAFSGGTAFVGLSQIRETATFGGLPIAALDRLECGVWAIDLANGESCGSVRFEDRVQEIFDIALLPGVKFPEVAEPASPVAQTSWYLPGPL